MTLKHTVFDIFDFKNEHWVRGPSRSSDMSPFDRAHMTSYSRSIVAIALSRVVSDLETRVIGHSRSLKVVPLDGLGMVSYYCSIVTLSLRLAVFEIFDLKTP